MTSPVMDPNGYANGLTGNLIPWIGSGIIALLSMLYTWIRTRTRHETQNYDRLNDHETRLGKLENATALLSDKMDTRFDRLDNKIDGLVGKLIDHLDKGD